MPNNAYMLFQNIMWKSENKQINPLLRKQEWLKLQHKQNALNYFIFMIYFFLKY